MSAMLSSTTPGVRSSPNLSHNAPVRCTTSASTSLLAEPAPHGGWTMPPATPPRGGTANSRTAVRSPSLPAHLLEQRARVLGTQHENVLNAAALLKVDRRQRTFAALAHDTACLQQMAAVLSQRLAMAAKESMVGLVEETQLYAVCMEELAVQISIHSMPLSEVASSLYRGFTLLFKRALEHEKARLAKEREAHAVTRENLAQALRQARESREEAAKSEGKLSVLRAAFDEKDRELTHAQDLYRQTRSQARRMRKLLDGYVHSTGSSKEPTFEDTPLKVLTDSVAKVDETAEEAERASEEIGRTVDTLHLMARALTMHSGKRRKEEAGVQTDAEDADTGGGKKPFELQRDKSALVGAKQASAMSKMRRRAIEGTITVYKGASLLPRALAQKVTFFLLTSDPAVIEAVIDDRSRSDTELSSPLAEHMYNVYLRLYGVKKLSEGHIASLLLTTLQMAEEGDERMVLFTSMLGLSSNPMEERDAQLVNLLYYELAGVAASSESDAPERVSGRATSPTRNHKGAHADHAQSYFEAPHKNLTRLILQEKVVSHLAAVKMLRQLFEHMGIMHRESFNKIMHTVDQLKYEAMGKTVLDIDAVVSAILIDYRNEYHFLRNEAIALFSAGDVNDDGVISLQEFKEILKLVMPPLLSQEKKIFHVFRECFSCSHEEVTGEEAEDVVDVLGSSSRFNKDRVPTCGASGIRPETFVAVVERMGILGVTPVRLPTAVELAMRLRDDADAARSGSPSSARINSNTPSPNRWSARAPIVDTAAPATSPASSGRSPGKRASTSERTQSSRKNQAPHVKLQNGTCMSILRYTWSETGEEAKRDIAAMRTVLSGCGDQLKELRTRGYESIVADMTKERLNVEAELRAISIQVDKVDNFLKHYEDYAQVEAWNTYREVVLKLNRFSMRVKEHSERVEEVLNTAQRESRLAGATAASGASRASRNAARGGSPAGAKTSSSRREAKRGVSPAASRSRQSSSDNVSSSHGFEGPDNFDR